MSETKANMADIEKFIRFAIKMGGIYDVDGDGYVVNKPSDDEMDERPVLIKFGSSYKRPLILLERSTDNEAAIINPLNENLAESQEHKWFYTMLNSGLVQRFVRLFQFVYEIVEISADGKADEMNLPHDVTAFISKHKNFDKKAYEHFRIIARNQLEFMRVWYHKKTKDSRFRCNIFSADGQITFPQVTTKSWKAISHLVSDVLGVSRDPDLAVEQISEHFFVYSDLLTVPRLESTLTLYSRLYSRINRYLEMIDTGDPTFVVDVAELDMHITRLSEYYKGASWSNTGTYTAPSKTGIRTTERPGSSLPTSGIPSNPMIGGRSVVMPMPIEDQCSNIPSNPNRMRQTGDIEYANSSTFANRGGMQYAQPQQQQFVRQMPSGLPMGPSSMGFGGVPMGGSIMPSATGISINPQLNMTNTPFGGGFSIN